MVHFTARQINDCETRHTEIWFGARQLSIHERTEMEYGNESYKSAASLYAGCRHAAYTLFVRTVTQPQHVLIISLFCAIEFRGKHTYSYSYHAQQRSGKGPYCFRSFPSVQQLNKSSSWDEISERNVTYVILSVYFAHQYGTTVSRAHRHSSWKQYKSHQSTLYLTFPEEWVIDWVRDLSP